MQKKPIIKSLRWKWRPALSAGLLVAVVAVQGCSSREGEPKAPGSATRGYSSQRISLGYMEQISTGSMGNKGVLMNMEPVEFREGRLSVKLRANTHIGNLADYDLRELTTLRFNGREVKPHAAGKLS